MTELDPDILRYFPSKYDTNERVDQDHFPFAFGYGSGVLKQKQKVNLSSPTINQVDLILVVNNSLKFHEANLKDNAHHYSFLRHFGASTITRLQETRGARIYFNPFVKLNPDSNTL
jgi:mitochondrial translocator assembly and maintenance protein 41